jgi:hypothetical protein
MMTKNNQALFVVFHNFYEMIVALPIFYQKNTFQLLVLMLLLLIK